MRPASSFSVRGRAGDRDRRRRDLAAGGVDHEELTLIRESVNGAVPVGNPEDAAIPHGSVVLDHAARLRIDLEEAIGAPWLDRSQEGAAAFDGDDVAARPVPAAQAPVRRRSGLRIDADIRAAHVADERLARRIDRALRDEGQRVREITLRDPGALRRREVERIERAEGGGRRERAGEQAPETNRRDRHRTMDQGALLRRVKAALSSRSIWFLFRPSRRGGDGSSKPRARKSRYSPRRFHTIAACEATRGSGSFRHLSSAGRMASPCVA